MGLAPKDTLGYGPSGQPQNVNPNPNFGFDPTQPLGPNNHLPGQNYFDQSIDARLIPGQQARGNSFYENALNYGLDKSGVPFSSGAPGQADSNDPMIKALQGQYERNVGQDLQGLMTQNRVNAPLMTAQEQGTVAGELGAEYQNQVSNYNQQLAYESERYNLMNQYNTAMNQAQSGLFGSLFSGIGTAAGVGVGLLAGGPAGAVAGGMIGGKL